MTIIAGDKVFHKSDPSIIWVVEKIEGDTAFCSTILKETHNKKEEKFSLITLEKKSTSPTSFYISKGRQNHY